jgi:putative RecB family exonuclease
LELAHELQLSAYSLLLRGHAPRPEVGVEIRSLIKTKAPRVETHRFAPRSAHHYERLFAVIGAYLDDLYRGRFIIRPGLLCGGCEFHQRQCRAWNGQ